MLTTILELADTSSLNGWKGGQCFLTVGLNRIKNIFTGNDNLSHVNKIITKSSK